MNASYLMTLGLALLLLANLGTKLWLATRQARWMRIKKQPTTHWRNRG